MINAIITRKKWLDKAPQVTTQKPYRNHVEPIEQSTDQPVLKLLHNVAHVGLEIIMMILHWWIKRLNESMLVNMQVVWVGIVIVIMNEVI